MRSIGVRELRQQASRHLREVERGETIQITDRGRPVALLTPLPKEEGPLARLRREGRLSSGKGHLRDLPPPLPPTPGVPLPSEILQTMRADAR